MTFAAVPNIPQQSELTDWEARFLSAIKQNVEMLTGQRETGQYAAIYKGQLTVQPVGDMQLQQITATGAGYSISGNNVPKLEDYVKLIQDVASLANDVAEVRAAFDTLVTQMKQ